MDPTEELDLGASDYTEEEKKDEELFGGISANKPFHPIVHEPVQDPVQQYYHPPNTPEAYQDYKKLTGELSALSSDASGLGQLRKARGDALDDFVSSTLAPFYRDTIGEGLLDATKSELDDPDSLFQRFDDHFSNPDFQDSLPKYRQIKDKYGRLKSDFSRYYDAEQNALARKDFLTKAKFSMPETFRRAADNYKAEKLTELSDKAVNDLLDTQEFEEPIYGREGLLNEDKLDPRIPHQGPLSRTGDPSKAVRDRQSKKLLAVKKEGLKGLQKNLALEKRDEGLRSQGINFSELGRFAGYPLYMNQGERQILNLEKARIAGATSFRGKPIEQAFEDLGGEDKLIASKMVETVFNAHNMVQDAAVAYWSDQTPENKEKFELAKKVREESWAQAARMGLGNEIPQRGDTVGFWAGLGNAFKRGDLQEDLSDFTPALLGAIDLDTAQQIIDIMEQTEELGMSSSYKNIKATKSKSLGEAFGKIFSNPAAIPEMVVETLTAFFSAWATEAPKMVAAGAATGAATGGLYGAFGGPKGAAGGAVIGGKAGAAWGFRLSAGAASFALEYAGEVLNEMGKMGIDWKNPHIFVAAWNNPKIREKIRAKAAKYAGGIALMDTIAAGVVGRVGTAVATKRPANLLRTGAGWGVARSTTQPILNPGGVTRTSRNVGRVADLAAQSGLGMSGEALGQIWSRDPGDPLIRDFDALVAEGLVEFAGPGGVGVVVNLINSKAASYNYGVYGYEEVVNNSITKDNGTVIEDVDKGGLKFQRQFFKDAATAEAELSQAGVNFNTVEGRVLKMLLYLMGGRIRNMGFAFSERSPTRDPSPGVYDQTSGTIFINLNESINHALTILHESGHFIEQMFPNINVKELYDQLTPEEKENHWASYLQQTEAKFKDLSKLEQFMYKGIPIWRKGEKGSARAASEWFAHMVVRVLTGIDQGVDTKVKSAVEDFINLFEDPDVAAQFLGSSEGANARETLAAVLMRALGVDANGAAYDLKNFYNLLEDENPRDSGIYPSINFGQNVNEWTPEQRDILAMFLGYYKGWNSISRSDQNSIAQWVAGSDMLSSGMQDRGTSLGDARSEGGLLASGGKTLAGSANQKPAPRQTEPGVHPDLKKRGGRAPGGPSLGATKVDVSPEGRPRDPFETLSGITSGRLEEEQKYQQTLDSLNLDRETTEEELSILEQQSDETAQEEAALQKEAEAREAQEFDSLIAGAEATAREEAALQKEAEAREAEQAEQAEQEYDYLYEEFGLEPQNEIQVDPEKGPLGATKVSREIENLLKLSVFPASGINNPRASALDIRIKKAQAEIRRKQVPGYSQKEINQLAENPLYVIRHMLGFRVDAKIRGYLEKRTGQSMQSLSMIDVDNAVGEYMDDAITQQLSQEAPEVEIVVPFGVHAVETGVLSKEKFELDIEEPVYSQKTGNQVGVKRDFSLVLPTDTNTFYSHNPVYEMGYQLETDSHIGSLGDLVNLRVPRDREDGKPGTIPIKKDSKRGKPIPVEELPDDHYAFEIVASSTDYEDGTLYHRYLLVSRTKKEATKKVPWHDVPLSRFSNTSSSYYKYHINPADREVYGDFVQKRGGYVVRQYATIYDALQDKVVREIGVKTRTNQLGEKYIPEGKPIEELAKLSGSAVNKGRGTQRFAQGPAFRVGGRNKQEPDQLSIADSTLVLNMAFATIETGKSNEISRNDISKAYRLWNRTLQGTNNIPYNSLINWNNYRTLNPDYAPINTTAALIQRVMSLMGKNSLPAALAPSDLVLLDAARIADWAKQVDALQPLLEKEGLRSEAQNEKYLTALKRLIVLAGHDISRMGDSQGNVYSQLMQNNNEDRFGFSPERTPREDMPFPRVTYKRKDPTNKEAAGPDEYDSKELETRGLTAPASFEPVIDFDLITYYGDESNPAISKGQMDYDPMTQRKRFTLRIDGIIVDNLTGKKVKSAKFLADYMADELQMDLGASSKSSLLKNHNNIKDIGKLDFFDSKWDYISELRYEKDHAPILKERSEKDYEPGAPTVELIQFLDDADQDENRVGIMGTSKVAKAEKEGKGISVLRKTGDKHFGNPFVYTSSAKDKDTIEVLNRQKAIEYFALWLLQDQIQFEFSEDATVTEYSHKKNKNGDFVGFTETFHLEDIQPERRKWILDQINSGKLDGKTLLYSAGSEGHMGANHAVFLQQYINAVRPQKEAPAWAIDWALGKTEEEGYYNWVLATKRQDVGNLMAGKLSNIITPEDKEAILSTRSLLGESGKSEIHDRPVFSDQEETPLSAANKIEKFTLASSQTPDTQNKLGRDQDRSIAGGLSRGLKWADRMLLAYFRADPSVKDPDAKLAAVTSTYGKIYWVSGNNFKKNNEYYKKKGLPLLKSEYFENLFDAANQEKFVLDAKLLLVRKLVADSHGLTERYGESIEVKASEDTSVESQVDPTSDDEFVGGQRDQSKTARSELMGDGGIQDDSALTPAEALEQQEESKDLADIVREALSEGNFGSDDLTMVNAFRKALGQAEVTPTEKQTTKIEKKDKDPKSFPLSSFIQKQLLKSIKDGTDTTIITDLSRALVKSKKIENLSLDRAENLIRQQLKILQDNNYKFTATSPASKEGTLVLEKATPTQGLISVSYPTPKSSSAVSGSKQTQFEFKSLEEFVEKLRDELVYEVGKADDKKVRLRNNGFLGASFLTSELQYSFMEKLRAGIMMYGKAAWDRLPENAKYAFRVNIFSQYISAEDLHARLLHAMEFKPGEDAQDFFDLQGHIIRNFATVKNAADLWRAEFREPIQEYLMEHGVDPEEWGAVAIALASGNLNRYLERKLKEAHENSYSVLHGELKYDKKTRKEYREGGLIKKRKDLQNRLKNLKSKNQNDARVKNSIEKTEKSLADIKTQIVSAKRKVKEIDLKAYYLDGQFVGAGMTNAEAIDAYNALVNKDNIKSLLENTDILDKFRDLNLAVIIKLGTSGFITNDQVFRMFITHYRPEKVNGRWVSPEQAYKNAIKFLESRGVQLDNTQIETDYSKLDPKIKGAWEAHYKESKKEVEAGLPAGYWYSPTAGFADVEGFWQTQEELAEVFGEGSKTGAKSAGRGIEASRAQRLFQFSSGRKANTSPPDPKAVLPIVFSSAENVLIRISKKPSSDHVIALYRLFLDLYENQNNFEEYANKHKAWQESDKKGTPPSSIQALLEAKGMEGIFQNENQLKILFEELDDIFDYMNFDKEKGHPVEDVVEAKEVTGPDGVKRLVVRHVMRRVDDKEGTIFIGREGGERVYAKFKENLKGKRFASEVKNMKHVPLWKILHNSYYSLNSVTRFMSMMFTSWNPDFLFTNQLRDAMNAILNMSEQSDEKFKKSLKTNYIKKVASSTKAIWRSEWRGDAVKKREKLRELEIPSRLEDMIKKFGVDGTDSDFYLAWWLYLDSKGLKTSFVKPESMEDIMREIDETFKDATQANAWSKIKSTKALKSLKSFGDKYVDPINTGVENSVRVVVAVEAIKAGMTEHQAITLGRRVSVDFNRKGLMSANLGALFVFFNAGVQGNLRFFRSLFMRTPLDQLKMVGGIAATSYLWAWLQMLISGDEEEDENFSHYDQISDVKKNGNIVAFMPGSKKHITIPLPYGWNWIWAMGQIGAQASAKSVGVGGQGKGLLAGAKDLMSEGYKQFVPIDSPMPTVAQPYFDLKNNKNFFGAPIEKVAFPFDPPTPQAYMNRKGTASFWKNLAISINSISGGDEVTPGSLKRMFGDNSLYNSPENDVEWALSGSAMEYIFNSLGGGAGATFSRVVSGAWGAAQGDFTVNWEQFPMVRRFYRDDYSSWKTLERFFSLRDRVNMANKYVKMLEKGGAPAKEASKAIKLNKNLITIKGMVDAADTQRKALKRKGEAIEKSKMSESEKRERLEKIEKQTLATYRKVLIKASKMGIEI